MEEKITINRLDITALEDSFTKSAQKCPAPDGPFREPKYVKYIRNQKEWSSGITYFTDKLLHLAPEVDSKIKIAILFEPPELLPEIYETIQKYEEHYHIIFTYAHELIERYPSKYKFFPADIAAIEDPSCKIHEKTKLISMIYSDKVELPGHQLRHIIAKKFLPDIGYNKVDFFGTGTENPIKNKSEGCNDYMFQIAIENTQRKDYFADKILDCFITGTVPIYWGCPNIGDYFDKRGILIFDGYENLQEILESLSEEKYNSMLKYVEKNFEIAKNKYMNFDDYFFEKIVEHLDLTFTKAEQEG
tara:strand:- start:2642 stop:3550 length:909 start_codon:yes stop_codon:yes gene_type:complete